jgi:hypothetical protein
MEVSGQLHAPASLLPGKVPLVRKLETTVRNSPHINKETCIMVSVTKFRMEKNDVITRLLVGNFFLVPALNLNGGN